MDIKLEKKAWYIRYRYYLAGGGLAVAGLVYVIVLALSPHRLRIDAENVRMEEVKHTDFLEYVDVEGVVQPILTLLVNTREAGNVERIVAEEGSLMKQGDTILILSNAHLMHDIEDQRDEWEKQRISYQEKALEMEQKTLTLRQQSLQAAYDLNKLKKNFELEKEEYAMGIRSKAQLEVSEDEFRYKTESTRLQMESLRSDSAMTVIRKELLRNDREREYKKLERSLKRMEDLVVRAPLDGQLSFVKVTPGQQVAEGENIAEVKVLDQFKIHTSLSEYYIDRVTTGLPATIIWQDKKYPLKVSKVVPEVKDRTFEVDLVFTGEGRLDYQTAMGKAPVGIAKMAKKHGAKVIALAGAVIEGAQECNEQGIDAYFPILRQVVTLDEAMDPATARKNMVETTEQVMRLVAAVK